MGAVTWIEVLTRHREVAARHRCAGPVIHVGRGYDNDIVVDDPFVAARHLRLSMQDDGSWLAEDLGTLNGLHVRGRPLAQARLAPGEEPLRIGNTWLRLRDATHAVAPERPLQEDAKLWPLAVGLPLLVVAMSLLDSWLGQTDRPRWGHAWTSALTQIALVLAWSGAWAVVTRVFSGAAHFTRQLSIACCTLLAVYVYGHASDLLTYALSWGGLAGVSYVAVSLIAATGCLAQLLAVSPRHTGSKAAVVFGMALAVIAWQTVSRTDLRETLGPNTVVSHLQPPAFRLARPRTVDSFLSADAGLKAALDKARVSEQAPPGSTVDDDDDD
ncbi:MAG: FHA domain-containing protein [Nevskia sp.]|nr:FHA domain-containing protein [Nevskia sp.]